MFEWFQEGTNIGFGMILRPLKLATWLELLKDLEKKKKDGMVFTVLHFDFLFEWELVNFGENKVESFNLLLETISLTERVLDLTFVCTPPYLVLQKRSSNLFGHKAEMSSRKQALTIYSYAIPNECCFVEPWINISLI